jgi:putative restriction endonuclease
MLSSTDQALLRLEIFADLELFIESRGGFASRDELTTFTLRSGQPMPIIDRNKGIRNPANFDATLSIVSASDNGRYNVYDDAIDRENGLLYYSWAQGPLDAGDNRKLNVAFEQQAPIILFEKPLANVYVPIIGVRVIDVRPDRRQFVIDLDDSGMRPSPTATLDKRYVERLVKQRVHQPVFRARVLNAYNKR